MGVSFFVFGMVEKVLVADTLAAFVDPALAHYADAVHRRRLAGHARLHVPALLRLLRLQHMAVGLGYLFGLRIPMNFNSPYKALDPSDFWRRWHISLSSCLRDYLYIPLGGNRARHLAHLSQPDADDAHRRPVARRELDVRRLGGLSRRCCWSLYRLSGPAWDRCAGPGAAIADVPAGG